MVREKFPTTGKSLLNGGLSSADLDVWLAQCAPQTIEGAYCGWLDAASRAPSYAYPEITGYMLTFAAYCRTRRTEVTGARHAAEWLMSVLRTGRLRCRPDKPGSGEYLFDLGMIAHGLLRYGTQLGEPRVIESGLAVVQDICRKLPPMTDRLLPLAGPPSMPPTWSTVGTAHLLKLLLALLSAATAGDEAAANAAHHLVETHGTPFTPSRTPPIVTCPGGDTVSLHAACYAAEGLWAYGVAQDHAGSLLQAREITRWAWSCQLADGGFPAFVTNAGVAAGRRQSDVLAQAIRLAHLTGIGAEGLDRAVEALIGSAVADGSGTAMIYAPGATVTHLNTWATMFAAQALALHEASDHRIEWPDIV